ncbi:hypothetical protein GmHk_20G058891 [Glycine max]|nr:hypothetical protein GmHk_20G058891 [Glycine max]
MPSDEIKSVYVRNLSPTVSASEIEEEFKNFGRIQPDGVVIRSRKDVGVCYAFVEFEDMMGVHNAVKAGSVEVAGRHGGVEVGVAINYQRHKEDVLVQGAFAGEVAKMEVNGSITNPKETVSIDKVPVKRGDILQGIKGQEMVRTLPNQHKVLRESNFEVLILFSALNSSQFQ